MEKGPFQGKMMQDQVLGQNCLWTDRYSFQVQIFLRLVELTYLSVIMIVL